MRVRYRLPSYLTLTAALAVTLFCVWRATGGKALLNWFTAWVCAPYFVMWVVMLIFRRHRFSRWILGVTLLFVLPALPFYAFTAINPNPPPGLIYVFVPVYHYAIVGPLLLFAFYARVVQHLE